MDSNNEYTHRHTFGEHNIDVYPGKYNFITDPAHWINKPIIAQEERSLNLDITFFEENNETTREIKKTK